MYLEESVLERKLPEADLKALVDLPAGLDYNEWLASHSKYLVFNIFLQFDVLSRSSHISHQNTYVYGKRTVQFNTYIHT